MPGFKRDDDPSEKSEPRLDSFSLDFGPLPGDPDGGQGEKFVCPTPGCPTIWRRFAVGDPVPPCEQHKCDLVRADP
jgi:hypothetical protein